MRKQILNLIAPFLVLTLTLSFIAVLPVTSQNTDAIKSKLEELHGKLQGQKALQNKVNAVIHQIEAGAFNGALNKLQNDVKKAILARVENPEELIKLVDEIIDLIKGIVPPPPPTPDFEITVKPSKLEIVQGGFDTSTITVTSKDGFNQTVLLINTTTAPGVTLSLNPSEVTPPPNGSVSSTLRVEVALDATPGKYEITLTGTNGSLTRSVNIALIITALPTAPDFSIAASPDTLTIQQGGADTSIITITSLNDFNQPVNLAVTSDSITGVTTTLNPTEVIPPLNAFTVSILTIDVATTALTGAYIITVTGESDSLKHSANITLEVTAPPIPPSPDFSITASPTMLTIEQGDMATSAIIVVSLKGFDWTVSLAITSEAIAGVTLTLDPNQVTVSPNGFATSTLKIEVAVTATPNEFKITIAGTSEALMHAVDISLEIVPETKPPKILSVLRLPEDAPSYNETVTVLASVTDMESGVKNVTLSYSRGAIKQNVTMTFSEGLYKASVPAFPYDAEVEYRVYAFDEAGNWAVSSLYSYVVDDPYPPDFGVPYWSPLEPAANEEITINVTVTEPQDASGVDVVTLLYMNTTLTLWRSISMAYEGGNWTAVIANQSDTVVEFYVSASDKADNSAESITQEFTVAPPPGFPLAWILAAIAVIAASGGGATYYVRRRRKKGASATAVPPVS